MIRKNNQNNTKTAIKHARGAGENLKMQVFSLTAPNAKKVQLVGDFTHWDQRPINMHREAEGVWRTSVPLETGTYNYRFLVDGQWCDDPECQCHAANPYGSQNAICKVA